MNHPLRSESDAYRFLLIAIGVAAVVVVVSLLVGPWVGWIVAIVLVGGVIVLYVHGRPREGPDKAELVHRGADDEHRVLVVANETVSGASLLAEIRRRSQGRRTEVLVVTPALNTKLRHWVSDEDRARAAAQKRLDASLALLAADGIEARGEVGDSDPLQAIADAVRTFGPDEIIISTHPEGRSNWLERGVVTGARERYAVPIEHVVVDLTAEAQPQLETDSRTN